MLKYTLDNHKRTGHDQGYPITNYDLYISIIATI